MSAFKSPENKLLAKIMGNSKVQTIFLDIHLKKTVLLQLGADLVEVFGVHAYQVGQVVVAQSWSS